MVGATVVVATGLVVGVVEVAPATVLEVAPATVLEVAPATVLEVAPAMVLEVALTTVEELADAFVVVVWSSAPPPFPLSAEAGELINAAATAVATEAFMAIRMRPGTVLDVGLEC